MQQFRAGVLCDLESPAASHDTIAYRDLTWNESVTDSWWTNAYDFYIALMVVLKICASLNLFSFFSHLEP